MFQWHFKVWLEVTGRLLLVIAFLVLCSFIRSGFPKAAWICIGNTALKEEIRAQIAEELLHQKSETLAGIAQVFLRGFALENNILPEHLLYFPCLGWLITKALVLNQLAELKPSEMCQK